MTLGSIANLKTGPFGTQFSASEYSATGTPILNVKSIGHGVVLRDDLDYVPDSVRDRLAAHTLVEGDIVFARKGSVDRHAYVSANEAGWIQGSDCIRVQCKHGVNSRFISHWLKLDAVKEQVNNSAVGSTMASLNTDILAGIHVRLPDPETQNAVAAFLSRVEDQVALNTQINDNLQAMLQTLYGYWFLQFNFPDENGRPYRASGGRMVWNDQLKREIPAGWRVASLVSNPLCEPLKPGVAPFSEKTYLATADVVGTTIKDGSRIRYETREGRANMEPVLHSVWFAKMKGSVKHLFLNEACASLISETILSTGFVGLKCEPVAFEYIASFIASEQFEPLKDLHAHGATQQAVNNTDLENILLPIPDAETLRRFSQLASSTLSRFNASIVENKRLQELRDWLLPMLMNGQATVASSDKLSFT